MKKGLFIIALILAMVLMLTPFPGNKAEAYYNSTSTYTGFPGNYNTYTGLSGSYFTSGGLYGGYASYGSLSGGYASYGGLYGGYGGIYGMGLYGAGWNPVSSGGGFMMLPARVYEPSYTVSDNGLGSSPPVSNSPQNLTQPGLTSIFQFPLPIMGTGQITYTGYIAYPQPWTLPALGADPAAYLVYPKGPEWSWSGFPAIPSLLPVFPQIPDFPPNPYWPDVYSMDTYIIPSGNIQIPR
ncbi:MAG: hypothetical protein ACMUIU_12640 [bacterium]